MLSQVFVEYVLLSGVNDSLEAAHELGALLQGRDVVLNLIPCESLSRLEICAALDETLLHAGECVGALVLAACAFELIQPCNGRTAACLLACAGNPVYSPDFHFKAPVEGQVVGFQEVLKQQYSVPCTVRQDKGQDISGECGFVYLGAVGFGCAAA